MLDHLLEIRDNPVRAQLLGASAGFAACFVARVFCSRTDTHTHSSTKGRLISDAGNSPPPPRLPALSRTPSSWRAGAKEDALFIPPYLFARLCFLFFISYGRCSPSPIKIPFRWHLRKRHFGDSMPVVIHSFPRARKDVCVHACTLCFQPSLLDFHPILGCCSSFISSKLRLAKQLFPIMNKPFSLTHHKPWRQRCPSYYPEICEWCNVLNILTNFSSSKCCHF